MTQVKYADRMGNVGSIRSLSVSDHRLGWAGVSEFVPSADGYLELWRLPRRDVLAIGDEFLAHRAAQPAGARMRFRTDARLLRLDLRAEEGSGALDASIEGGPVRRIDVGGRSGIVEIELGGGGAGGVEREGARGVEREVELWMPHAGRVGIRSIALADGSGIAPAPPRPRFVAYGSSITQCTDAAGPSETWPALVARAHGWDLHGLGFAGACYLDPIVAETMAAALPDVAFVCAGINIWERATHTPRMLRAGLLDFVRCLAASGAPAIAVMSPIVSPERERVANAAGVTLAQVRDEVERAARIARNELGLPVHPIPGLTVFDAGEMGLFRDGLHPTSEGYAVMAERLSPVLAGIAAAAGISVR